MIFIYLKGIVTHRAMFNLPVHSPSTHKVPKRPAKLNPGILHVQQRSEYLNNILCLSGCILAGSSIRSGIIKICTDYFAMRLRCLKQWLNQLIHKMILGQLKHHLTFLTTMLIWISMFHNNTFYVLKTNNIFLLLFPTIFKIV